MSASTSVSVTADINIIDDSFERRDSQLTSAPTASFSLCPLCCDEDLSASPTSGMTLSTCGHRSCSACLAKWVEREEASGQASPPTCPFCRSNIGEEDVLTILGRPFRPRLAVEGSNSDDDEIDELTLHWIDEHTAPCGGCGARIEKVDGCDLIECLCGYRFCYVCGAAGGGCGCNPGHVFPNDHCSLNDFEYIPDAPIRDGDGRVNLRSCIRRTEVLRERGERRDEKIREESNRWKHSEEKAAVCTANGRWLFVPARDAGCVSMLTQQVRHSSIKDKRSSRKWQDGPSDANLDASWLYLRRGADVRSMRQFLARNDVRSRRTKRNNEKAREVEVSTLERGLNSLWLFIPNLAGFELLKGMVGAVRKRMRRAQAREEESSDLSDVDVVIRSGAWLFQNYTKVRTQSHLVRLFKHSEVLERKKFWRLFLVDLGLFDDGCDELRRYFEDLLGGAGCCGKDCPDCIRRKAEDGDQCLISILHVFPWENGLESNDQIPHIS